MLPHLPIYIIDDSFSWWESAKEDPKDAADTTKTTTPPKEDKLCTCDVKVLLQSGCQCGGK